MSTSMLSAPEADIVNQWLIQGTRTDWDNERLFHSVEVALLRQWGIGRTPDFFNQQQGNVLRHFVNGWWNLYHESLCASQQLNRTIWCRPLFCGESYPLPTDRMVVRALIAIRSICRLEAIEVYRQLKPREIALFDGLLCLIDYYHREG